MSLRESLSETLQLYGQILKELRSVKAGEYKEGMADGLEMTLEAIRVCLEEDSEQKKPSDTFNSKLPLKNVEVLFMSIEINGKAIELDEDGFIVDPALWDETVAAALAPTEEVSELTEDHWKLINYLRDYYAKFGIAPMIRKVTKESGFSLQQIYELFPTGPAKGACKIAGLPKPTGCV